MDWRAQHTPQPMDTQWTIAILDRQWTPGMDVTGNTQSAERESDQQNDVRPDMRHADSWSTHLRQSSLTLTTHSRTPQNHRRNTPLGG